MNPATTPRTEQNLKDALVAIGIDERRADALVEYANSATSAQAALAAAKEDTERLIEATTACVEQIKHIEYLRQINGGPVPATMSGEVMAYAIAAIDSARREQQQAQP